MNNPAPVVPGALGTGAGTDLAAAVAAGPWNPDALATLVALGGTWHDQTHPDGRPYRAVCWHSPWSLYTLAFHLLVLGWEDPTEGDHERWFWLVEVWDQPEDAGGRMLAQHRTHDRAVLLGLLTDLHNLTAATAPAVTGPHLPDQPDPDTNRPGPSSPVGGGT